jgi:hypothetical protein
MRFTIRDLLWLITGFAIAFATLGTMWRAQFSRWNVERELLRAEWAASEAQAKTAQVRAAQAERNLKGLQQDLQDPAVIHEIVIAAKAEEDFRKQRAREASSKKGARD